MIFCCKRQRLAEAIENQGYFLKDGHKVFPFGCSACGEWLSDFSHFAGDDSHPMIILGEFATLRAENKRLRNLVGSLISETNGYKPYARLCVLGWTCVYCKHLWNDDGPEHHADDCPVVIGRAEMAEEG